MLQASGEAGWARVFEVRDKPVSEADLHHFLHKAASLGVRRLAMVAVAPRQPALELDDMRAAAARQGVQLVVRSGWGELVDDVTFWAQGELEAVASAVPGCVDARLIDLDVRSETLAEWRAMSENHADSGGTAHEASAAHVRASGAAEKQG